MKKIVLLLFLSFFAFSFAKNTVDYSKNESELPYIWYIGCGTSCGITVWSASYEPVSEQDMLDWCRLQDQYYCEQYIK